MLDKNGKQLKIYGKYKDNKSNTYLMLLGQLINEEEKIISLEDFTIKIENCLPYIDLELI